MKHRRIATAYFVVQSIGIAAWWLMILVNPATRLAFGLRDPTVLLAFAPGDLSIVALGIYIGMHRGRGSALVAPLLAGAMLYAALYTVAAAFAHRASPLSAVLMVPAAIASTWAAAVLSQSASSSPVSSGAGS